MNQVIRCPPPPPRSSFLHFPPGDQGNRIRPLDPVVGSEGPDPVAHPPRLQRRGWRESGIPQSWRERRATAVVVSIPDIGRRSGTDFGCGDFVGRSNRTSHRTKPNARRSACNPLLQLSVASYIPSYYTGWFARATRDLTG